MFRPFQEIHAIAHACMFVTIFEGKGMYILIGINSFTLGMYKSHRCSHVTFPHHPQKRFRRQCNAVLMKTVISCDAKKSFVYPKLVYCYRSIKDSVQELLNREGFKELLLNDPLKSESNHLADMCDWEFFKTFKDDSGSLFFSDKRNIGAIVILDWFNPFKHQEYSMGILYMVFVNLPRHVRFKWENAVVLGVISGPKEAKYNLNSFLKPFIEELIDFWNGVCLKEQGRDCLYKLAIICISSDILATRKFCGFKSHNAIKGIFM